MLFRSIGGPVEPALEALEEREAVTFAAQTAGRFPAVAQVRVADDGIGIDPDDQAHIFERFYRADKSHSQKISGTGLGLAIVKHVCEIHGGTVDVESTPGKGSVFTLHFPLPTV